MISCRLVVVGLTAGLVLASVGAWGAEDANSDRHVELTYGVTVKDLPADTQQAVAYLPIPPTNEWQVVAGDPQISGAVFAVVTDPEYGNQFLCFDLTSAERDAQGQIVLAATFDVTRRAHSVLNDGPIQPVAGPLVARFLQPDALVPLDGAIAAEATQAVGQASDPLAQLQACFDDVVDSMDYDKTGEGWGRGDALYACDVRKGNCTDFHSLLIGMARSLKIPARFIMGLPLPADQTAGTIAGYHCWAEFYLDGYGWVPADASESRKHPEQRALLFGGLDANRVEFTLGRDIPLPGATNNPRNFLIYPYVEVDGQEYSAVERSLSFRDL